MHTTAFLERLAVCSWSLQPATPQELLEYLRTIAIPRVQIALNPIRQQPATWKAWADLCGQQGIQMISGMFGTVGEDYSTPETIRRTGGVVPDATWEENWKNIQADAGLAHTLGLRLVTFHAGFLPHDERDPDFAKLTQRIRAIADLFASKGIDLGFETGQETAETLKRFLEKLDRKNVGVNFDPANMILYDMGDPISALRTLAPWLKQCHLKDANRTKVPGTWGEEVVAGTGQVNWEDFFDALREANFAGYCCIEREAGNRRVADIIAARKMVESAG